jgi:inner membrane protease subunit 1
MILENSMEPTLSHGEIVISCPPGRLNLTNLLRGDVIITRNPTQPQERICKRIVGLPGDRVPTHYKGPEMFVPAGQVWLEGDHRAVSRDSNTYGAVPLGLVEGKLICSVWPINFNQEQLHKELKEV